MVRPDFHAGAGLPIVLLHGFDSSLLEFRRLFPLLANSARSSTYAVDLIGWGFSCCGFKDLPDLALGPEQKTDHLYSFWKSKVAHECGMHGYPLEPAALLPPPTHVFGHAGPAANGAGGHEPGGCDRGALCAEIPGGSRQAGLCRAPGVRRRHWALVRHAAPAVPPGRAGSMRAPADKHSNPPRSSSCALLLAIWRMRKRGSWMENEPPPQVLRSVPLRSLANQMAYHDKETLATQDAVRVGRLHTHMPGPKQASCWTKIIAIWCPLSQDQHVLASSCCQSPACKVFRSQSERFPSAGGLLGQAGPMQT